MKTSQYLLARSTGHRKGTQNQAKSKVAASDKCHFHKRRLASRMYKELPKLNNKKLKCAQDMKTHFTQ